MPTATGEPMARSRWPATLFILGLVVTVLSGCMDSGDTYTARVDRIEPPIPGLVVTGGNVQGGLYLKNNTGMDVYIYDAQGREQFKVTPQALFVKDEQGEWAYVRKGNELGWDGGATYTGSRGNQPAGRYSDQVMKEWVVAGRAGDTPFEVYGRTVYDPR